MLAPWKKNDDKPRQGIKKQRHHFANKSMLFPVVMYRCESWTNKEGWVPKNWCFQSVVLEKALERLRKEIKSVNPQGNQHWIFIERTDAEAEAPILWPLDTKSWLVGKDPGAGKHWGQEEKGVTEDEMVGWHHQLNEHDFKQTPGESERGKPSVLQFVRSQRVGCDWGWTTTWHWPLSCPCSQSLSCVWLFVIPWTVARQDPLSVDFPRQKYRSGLSLPTPGDLPDTLELP